MIAFFLDRNTDAGSKSRLALNRADGR